MAAVEVRWRIEGVTTLPDVTDTARAADITHDLLDSLSLPNFEAHRTVFEKPEILGAEAAE